MSAPAQPASPELVRVTGTKVSLAPPNGFKPSERFPGFGIEDSQASILVTEMPAPVSKMAESLTAKNMATQNMTLLSKREVSLGGRPASLYHLRQIARGDAFLKWLVLLGTEKETVFITATFPEAAKARFSAALERAVLTARWDAEAATDPLAGLTFSIQDDPALKFARRVSNAVMLTRDGTLPGKPNNDPMMIVAPSLSAVEISDVKTFAEARLMQIAQVSGIVLKKQSEVTIAGLPGSEIVAEAAWKDHPQDRCVIYQALLVDGRSYFLLQAFAPLDERQKYLEIFRRIAQSFRKK
jgi:hypothetical protein